MIHSSLASLWITHCGGHELPWDEGTPQPRAGVHVARPKGSPDHQGKLGGCPAGTCPPSDAEAALRADSVCGRDAEPAHQLSPAKIPDPQESGERTGIVVLSC